MNQPSTDTPPPPEAVLIRRARQSRGMSPEKAAPLTGVIRASQWRNIESGKTSAKDEVLAHMAYVVRVAPEELEEVGKGEAAQILRRIQHDRADPDVQGEDESRLAWMDRQYRLWRDDEEKAPVLKGLFESWGGRDTG